MKRRDFTTQNLLNELVTKLFFNQIVCTLEKARRRLIIEERLDDLSPEFVRPVVPLDTSIAGEDSSPHGAWVRLVSEIVQQSTYERLQ